MGFPRPSFQMVNDQSPTLQMRSGKNGDRWKRVNK